MPKTEEIYFYTENNIIVGTEIKTNKCKFYSIYGDFIEPHCRLTYHFNKHINLIHDRIICLEKCFIV